ncbi:methyltransferase domain-containing protein [Rhodococcus sp. HNM0569]|uniref:class I SAM-dependent methyltransferase n=1 Tax=Rhodococcus sp. HNM0569 TaxID=2716340 RepID=UPI00146A2902|nr:methyltransferase domain-containing protein [Rhodococcus sp. HNM0569]NLU83819.1 methyltransferase domain-containing protein [Rhodococcus sp. HNM0569]
MAAFHERPAFDEGPAWIRYADVIDDELAPVTSAMLGAAAPADGESVLDVAGVTAGVGLAAAERVGKRGHVVIGDRVPVLVAAAQERATRRSLTQVSTRILVLTDLDVPASEFDAVVCRFGLLTEPGSAAAAIDEMVRVLRPGGRLAVAVWGPRADNPWLGVVLDAFDAVSGSAPPRARDVFAFGSAGALESLLSVPAFAHSEVHDVDVVVHGLSFPSWWERTLALHGSIASALDALDETTRAAITAHVERRLGDYRAPGPAAFALPGIARVGTAHLR